MSGIGKWCVGTMYDTRKITIMMMAWGMGSWGHYRRMLQLNVGGKLLSGC